MTVLFASSVRADETDLERLIWRNWSSKNAPLLDEKIGLKRHIELAQKLGELPSKDHDRWSDSANDEETIDALHLKLAVQGQMLKILGQYGKDSYDDFESLSSADQKAVVDSSESVVDLVIRNGELKIKLSREFGDWCDEKIALIFGGENPKTVGAATGQEPVSPTGGSPFFRFHLVANAHVYTDVYGTKEKAPIYAPPGWTRAYAGRDTENASYILVYPKLGRRSDVVLNVLHLADARMLLKPGTNQERNPTGSLRIGSMGGPGGHSSPGSKKNYSHSHLILRSGDLTKRYTFFDTFCK